MPYSLVGIPIGVFFLLQALLQPPSINDQFVDTLKNIVVVVGTFLLPIMMNYARNTRLKQKDDKEETDNRFKEMAKSTSAENAKLSSRIVALTDEIDVMRGDYKQVTLERNEAVESLKIARAQRVVDEEKWRYQNNQLTEALEAERKVNKQVLEQNANQEIRISELERLIGNLKPVNELATAIAESILVLANKRTSSEMPAVKTELN